MTTGIALDRIRFFVGRLADPTTSRTQRLECWRLIASAAVDAHSVEVEEMDSLKTPMEDPSMEAPIA